MSNWIDDFSELNDLTLDDFYTERLPPLAEDLIEQSYIERMRPVAWHGAALKLMDGAEIIIADQAAIEEIFFRVALNELPNSELQFPNHAPAYLLYAYAFENLFKGIIVAKEPELLSRDLWKFDSKLSKGDRSWMTHNMKTLMQRAGIELPDSIVRLLFLLQQKAMWSGRYPVSREVSKLIARDQNDEIDFLGIQFRRDILLIRAVFLDLEGILKDLIEKQLGNFG